MSHPVDDDAWWRAEAPLGREAAGELGRLVRRARARWPWVLLLALALGAAATWRVVHRQPLRTASVTLAVSEGQLAARASSRLMSELRAYVANVLLPDASLAALIERRDLFPLRRTLGLEFALTELRAQIEVDVRGNTFLYTYDDSRRSARVDLAVEDADPELATALARELAAIIVETAANLTRADAARLAEQAAIATDAMRARVSALARRAAAADHALEVAPARTPPQQLALLREEAILAQEQWRRGRADLAVSARAASLDEISAAAADQGLGLRVAIVAEEPALAAAPGRVRIAALLALVAFGALAAAALAVGALDQRIRDARDVTRLGLPVLGSLPPFAGDHVGSLRDRGVPRRRVPSRR